jgi:hypothetical protein
MKGMNGYVIRKCPICGADYYAHDSQKICDECEKVRLWEKRKKRLNDPKNPDRPLPVKKRELNILGTVRNLGTGTIKK